MAQSYTRQSSFSDGDTITAALFNNEYNQLVNAFTYSSSSATSTGHRHDGTAGHGGNIHTIGDLDFLNKIMVSSNTWEFYVEVSSAAAKQMILQDGALVPNADSDLDLGTSSVYFKKCLYRFNYNNWSYYKFKHGSRNNYNSHYSLCARCF